MWRGNPVCGGWIWVVVGGVCKTIIQMQSPHQMTWKIRFLVLGFYWFLRFFRTRSRE